MIRAQMTEPLYPLLFTPVYKDYIWGGQRLPTKYGRKNTPDVCAESWEISAHSDGMSVVANGAFAGLPLAALTQRLGVALLGSHAAGSKQFPLLFKLIDARQHLSVQVHPADDNAGLVGGEAKTEMWYVVDREPGSVLYAGLKPGVTPEMFRAAMSHGTVPDFLYRLDVTPGEALFIPGGLVHAIGAGCFFYEVQKSSNTTYRLYDWGRFDASGQPRPLHLHQAFQVINPALPAPRMIPPPAPVTGKNNRWSEVLACPHFHLRRLDLFQGEDIRTHGESFHALFVAEGSVTVSANGVQTAIPNCASALIPAGATSFRIEPTPSSATVLVTTLGHSNPKAYQPTEKI